MTNPVPGYEITTPFGVGGNWAAGYHTGDDYAAPKGTKVVAAIGGTVVKTGWAGDYGNQVIIETMSIRHSYNHLDTILVRPGQLVGAGTNVGSVGSTGRSTGPHLHYEERISPYLYANHRKPEFNKVVPVANTAPYVTKDIYSDRLGYGQDDSDTVKELQERLNRIKLVGGTKLPVTGYYGPMTDKEVRLWQEQVCHDEPDPKGRSFLGPLQRARMFPVPPYVIHDVGLPAIAGADGGGGGTDPDPGGGGGVDPAPTPFLAPSLVVLKREVDERWPNRGTGSDGWLGDEAHQKTKSEHNPVGHPNGPKLGTPGSVHAIDITVAGTDAKQILDAVIGDERVWYVIHTGSIWSKNYNWAQRDYNGSDPHNAHIHISIRPDENGSQEEALKAEKDTSQWLAAEPIEPPAVEYVTRAEFDAWRAAVAEAMTR